MKRSGIAPDGVISERFFIRRNSLCSLTPYKSCRMIQCAPYAVPVRLTSETVSTCWRAYTHAREFFTSRINHTHFRRCERC